MQDEDTDGMSVVSRPNSSPAPGEDGYYHRIGSHRDLTAEQEIQMLRAQNAHMRQALESYADLPPFNHHMATNGFEHAYMETAVPDSSISYRYVLCRALFVWCKDLCIYSFGVRYVPIS